MASGPELGNGAPHELVEQGDREGDLPMCGAVDHPFLDEFGADGSQAAYLHLQLVGDSAHPLPSRAQLGDRPQEALFRRRETSEANSEKVVVQPRDDALCGGFHVGKGDGALLGDVP